MGLRTQLLLVIALVFCGSTVNALPSLDPKFRTQVQTPDGTVIIARDPFDPMVWYYTPPALRLAEVGEGKPKFRWVEFVLDGRQHAILQFAVRADVGAESENLMRQAAVKWFEDQRQRNAAVVVPNPQQIRISPVGPLKQTGITAMMLRNNLLEIISNADSSQPLAVVYPAVPARETAQAAQPPALPVKAAENLAARVQTLPGVTELSQETWLQYEISGPGVQVVKDLITGGTPGGMIVVYWGKYTAFTPELSVTVTLNVKAFASYFRDRKSEASGWSFFGLIGHNSTRLEDYINQRTELQQALDIAASAAETSSPKIGTRSSPGSTTGSPNRSSTLPRPPLQWAT